MSDPAQRPAIILVPGHWLGAWAWDDVVARLAELGCPTHPLTLPGLDPDDPGRAARTIAEQAAAVVSAMREAHARTDQRVVMVGHSGANTPVSVALDRHPELVGRVVWVDSGPVADGAVFAPDLDKDLVELPLPAFDVLGRHASLDGLDADTLDRFRRRAVPEPGPVVTAPVHLTDDARRDVPTTLVCCSIPSDQVMAMAAEGHPMMAEAATLRDVSTVDLPTGHWPMWSRAQDLADVISTAASASRRS